MATERVDARQLKVKGSAQAHDSLVRACCELLELRGIVAAPINQKARQDSRGRWRGAAPVGFPDIVACAPFGQLVLIECKTGGARVHATQRDTLAEWSRAGALCLTVRSVDELQRALQAEGLAR